MFKKITFSLATLLTLSSFFQTAFAVLVFHEGTVEDSANYFKQRSNSGVDQSDTCFIKSQKTAASGAERDSNYGCFTGTLIAPDHAPDRLSRWVLTCRHGVVQENGSFFSSEQIQDPSNFEVVFKSGSYSVDQIFPDISGYTDSAFAIDMLNGLSTLVSPIKMAREIILGAEEDEFQEDAEEENAADMVLLRLNRPVKGVKPKTIAPFDEAHSRYTIRGYGLGSIINTSGVAPTGDLNDALLAKPDFFLYRQATEEFEVRKADFISSLYKMKAVGLFSKTLSVLPGDSGGSVTDPCMLGEPVVGVNQSIFCSDALVNMRKNLSSIPNLMRSRSAGTRPLDHYNSLLQGPAVALREFLAQDGAYMESNIAAITPSIKSNIQAIMGRYEEHDASVDLLCKSIETANLNCLFSGC